MKSTWNVSDLPVMRERLDQVVAKRQAERDAAKIPVDAAIARYNSMNWLFKLFTHRPMSGWCNYDDNECVYSWARTSLFYAKELQKRVDLAVANNVTSITLSYDELEILKDL